MKNVMSIFFVCALILIVGVSYTNKQDEKSQIKWDQAVELAKRNSNCNVDMLHTMHIQVLPAPGSLALRRPAKIIILGKVLETKDLTKLGITADRRGGYSVWYEGQLLAYCAAEK